MTFDPFGLQHAMDPEAIEPGLLDHDDRVTALRSHHEIPEFLPAPDGNEPWLNLNGGGLSETP